MKRFALAFSLLAAASLAHGAGRVFHDAFESGKMSPQWANQSNAADPCVVVSVGVDGGLPHDGLGQLQCFWHAGVGRPQDRTNEHLDSWPYTREFFTRIWFRFDNDINPDIGWTGGGAGPEIFSISPLGYNSNNGQNLIGVDVGAHIGKENPVDTTYDGSLHISWLVDGGGYSGPNFFGLCYAYDGYYGNCLYPQAIGTVDHQWHEVEIYHRDDTFTAAGVSNKDGAIKTWIDHHLVIDVENDHTTINGAKWNNFNLGAIWWNSNTLQPLSHVYFDGFEIFSDAITDGSTGSMVDASIAAPAVCTP